LIGAPIRILSVGQERSANVLWQAWQRNYMYPNPDNHELLHTISARIEATEMAAFAIEPADRRFVFFAFFAFFAVKILRGGKIKSSSPF
jgi:hypothetical protein